MSERSAPERVVGDIRGVTSEEIALVEWMLRSLPLGAANETPLKACKVRSFDNGGMGGFEFVGSRSDRRFSETISEAIYKDSDGVECIIQLNVDDFGDLMELDIWKTDFSPLVKFPLPDECRMI